MQKLQPTRKQYDGANVRRRESDLPEDSCEHKSSQGSLFKSKFCPNCGAQIWKRADEDDNAQEERAAFHSSVRAGLSGRKKA